MKDMSIHDDVVIFDDVSEERKIQRQQWKDLTLKLSETAYIKKIPIKLTMELTPECNLECKMCYVRLNKSEMKNIGRLLTADEWITIAKDAAEEGTLYINLTGGEPLLHPEFEKIYVELSKLGCCVTLLTNAVNITEKTLELLKKYPPVSIAVTLYGASEETYQKVCNNGKAFNSVVNNINRIKKALPNTPMNLSTTFIKDNINDLDGVIAIAKKMDLILNIDLNIIKAVRGAVRPEISECRLSRDQVKNILYEYIYKDFLSSPNEIGNLRKDRSFACTAGIGACVVTWDGKMIPCLMFSTPYTDPVKNGFAQAWKELKELRDKITAPERCINCKKSDFCGKCPAFIQAESGTYIDGESYSCESLY